MFSTIVRDMQDMMRPLRQETGEATTASVEEISLLMEEMTSNIKQNAAGNRQNTGVEQIQAKMEFSR